MGKLDEILSDLTRVKKNLETLERGVYGDDKNEVKGLTQTVRELEKIVKTLKDDRKADKLKVVYFGLGAWTIIGIIGWLIDHFFIK